MNDSPTRAASPQVRDYRDQLFVRRIYTISALVGFAVVIYGSFVPFAPTGITLEQALQAFFGQLQSGIRGGSRVDLGVNVLIMVPSAFAMAGALTLSYFSRPPLVPIVIVTALACGTVSLAVEFGQLFFSRTSSWLDIYAQLVGAGLGLGLWLGIGRWLTGMLVPLSGSKPAPPLIRAVKLYAAGFLGYSLLPLDLTIHPVQLYQKWKAGKVLVAPFSTTYPTLGEQLYAYGTDIAVWIPIGVLAMYLARAQLTRAFVLVLFASFGLEALQLLVQSRVSDSTDIVLAMLGGLVGILLLRQVQQYAITATGTPSRSIRAVAWYVPAVYLLGLLIIYAYPYNFDLSPSSLRAGLSAMPATFMWAYQFGSITAGLFDMVRTIAMFGVFGCLVRYALGDSRSRLRTLGPYLVVLCAGAVAAVIEVMKLALPGRYSDPTDVLVAALGAGLGYGLVGTLFMRHSPAGLAAAAEAERYVAQPESPRLSSFDGLRACAALSVFGVHLQQVTGLQLPRIGPMDPNRLLENGNTGVALFFMLSGCLLSLPMWSTHPAQAMFSPAYYAARRAARIVPAYYLCLLSLLALYALRGEHFGLENVTAHLMFLHSWSDEYFYAINSPFWTIAIEAQFYVLLGIGLVLATRSRISNHGCAVVVAALLTGTYIAHRAVIAWAEEGSDGCSLASAPSVTHSLLAHMPLFLAGMLVGYVLQRWPGRIGRIGRASGAWDTCFVSAVVALFLILGTPADDWFQVCGGRYNFPYVPALLALVLLSSHRSRIAKTLLDNAPARYLGTISYGVYLFHLPIQKLLKSAFEYASVSTQGHWIVFGFVSLFLVVFVSTVSYLIFERPILNWTRQYERTNHEQRAYPP